MKNKRRLKNQITKFLLHMREEVLITRLRGFVIWSNVQEKSERAEHCQDKRLYLRSENTVCLGWLFIFSFSLSLFELHYKNMQCSKECMSGLRSPFILFVYLFLASKQELAVTPEMCMCILNQYIPVKFNKVKPAE